jgi:hypothetical protein
VICECDGGEDDLAAWGRSLVVGGRAQSPRTMQVAAAYPNRTRMPLAQAILISSRVLHTQPRCQSCDTASSFLVSSQTDQPTMPCKPVFGAARSVTFWGLREMKS